MASTLFEDDIVQRRHRGVLQFGLIIGNYDHDGYSSAYEDSEYEEEDADKIQKGFVRVAWYPNGREEVLTEEKLNLYHRSLIPGAFVRRKQEVSQRGIVRSMDVSCHLHVLRTKQMVYGIPSTSLEHITVYTLNMNVVMGSWIGMIRSVYAQLIVRLKNGARCVLSDDNACRLSDVHDKTEEGSYFSKDTFFVGQVLRGPATTFKSAVWLNGPQPILSSKANFTVTVEDVKVIELDVHWQTRGLCRYTTGDCTASNQLQPPSRKVTEDMFPSLKLLSYFMSASVQIGDREMYCVQPEDLGYPKAVFRRSMDSFVKPPANLASEFRIRTEDACPAVAGLFRKENQKLGESPVEEAADRDRVTGTGNSPSRCTESPVDDESSRRRERCREPRMKHELRNDGSSSGLPAPSSKSNVPSGELVHAPLAEGTSRGAVLLSMKLTKLRDKVDHLGRGSLSKSNRSFDVVPLGELYRELCEAFDGVTACANDLQGILQCTVDASVPEVKGQVSQLLECQEKLHQQIEIAKSILDDSKKTLNEMDIIGMDCIHVVTAAVGTAGVAAAVGTAAAAAAADETTTDKPTSLRNSQRMKCSRGSKARRRPKLQDESSSEDGDADSSSDSENSDISSNASSRVENRRHRVISSLLQRHTKKKHRRLVSRHRRPPPKILEAGERVCVEVTNTSSLVDVMWQDGTLENGIVSTELVPVHHLDELELFPGDFVTRNNESLENEYGLVCRMDRKERTCLVQWIACPNQQCNVPKLIHTEEVSVYELSPHPDFKFDVGDVVVRIADTRHVVSPPAAKGRPASPCSSPMGEQTGDRPAVEAKTMTRDGPKGSHFSKGSQTTNQGLEVTQSNLDAHDVSRPLDGSGSLEELQDSVPCAGQVRWVNTNGQINVAWVDGSESSVYPHDLYKLEEDSESDWSENDQDDGHRKDTGQSQGSSDSSSNSWETASGSAGSSPGSSDDLYSNGKPLDKAAVSLPFPQSPLTSEEEAPLISQGAAVASSNQREQSLNRSGSSHKLGTGMESSRPEEADVTRTDSSLHEQADMTRTGKSSRQQEEVTGVPSSLSKGAPTRGVSSSHHRDPPSSELDETVEQTLSAFLGRMEVKLRHINSFANSILVKEGVPGNVSKEKGSTADVNTADQHRVKEQCISTAVTEDNQLMETALAEDCRHSARGDSRDSDSEPNVETPDLSLQEAATSTSSTMALATMPSSHEEQALEDDSTEDFNQDSQVSCPKAPFDNVPATAVVPTAVVSTAVVPTAVVPTAVVSAAAATAAGVGAGAGVGNNFFLMDEVTTSHRFKTTGETSPPEDPKVFALTIRREMRLLQTSLPCGIHVKGFADRMDLFSVLFEGPYNTPYEDGLFLFDAHLPPDYPKSPPVMHYHAYCCGRLNPNLYEDGKVCISLLGTWMGKGSEVWTSKSNLLQVLVSIQGLILVSEPYYNEAGYEKHRGSPAGVENSRLYNETAVLKMVQSMTLMLSKPPEVFHDETVHFCHQHGFKMIKQIELWLTLGSASIAEAENQPGIRKPAFPLLPVSKGFVLSMKQALRGYRAALGVAGITDS